MAIIHSLKCTVPFSFVVPLLSLALTHCHLFSLVVTRCITRCHSLSLVVPLAFVVTRCTTLRHSLSFVVIHCTIRCHSLSLIVPPVVIRCTTRLSFYKRSFKKCCQCHPPMQVRYLFHISLSNTVSHSNYLRHV